jgi:hypothetical protein
MAGQRNRRRDKMKTTKVKLAVAIILTVALITTLTALILTASIMLGTWNKPSIQHTTTIAKPAAIAYFGG